MTLRRIASQPELQMEAILVFCRQNLHDPELSPQRVADRFGISVRTLHLRLRPDRRDPRPLARWKPPACAAPRCATSTSAA